MIEFLEYFDDDEQRKRYLRALRENEFVVNTGNPNHYKLHEASCKSISNRDSNWNGKIVFADLKEARSWIAKQDVKCGDCGCVRKWIRSRGLL